MRPSSDGDSGTLWIITFKSLSLFLSMHLALLVCFIEGSLLEFKVDLVGVGLCEDGSLVRAAFFSNFQL